MKNRGVEIAGFLAQHGWDDALQSDVPADFSPRRYARLKRADGKRAILMDADRDQKTEEFIDIAMLLRSLDISAPEIYAADPMAGLVIMEYLGNQNMGAMLDTGANAKALYQRAVDVLIHLHKNFDKEVAKPLDLPVFGGALFASQVELFLDYYFPFIKEREATGEEGEAFRAAWKEVLKGIDTLPQSLLLRDFMPDNLMDLPDRKDWRSVGVLDFQDAGLGPTAYDLASLCEVVRREGGDVLLDDMLTYYHQKAAPQISLPELTNACQILSAQRHMRILGIIARLVQKTGQREKLDYVPRVWGYLNQLLTLPNLETLKNWVQKTGLSTCKVSQ